MSDVVTTVEGTDDPSELENANQGLLVEIYHRDDWTDQRRTMTRMLSARGLVGVSELGYASFALSGSDRLLRGGVTGEWGVGEFAMNNIARFRWNGRVFQAQRFDSRVFDRISEGENGAQTFTVAGPGLAAALDDAVVMPESHAVDPSVQIQRLAVDQRPFTFAADQFVESGWGTADDTYSIVPLTPDDWPASESPVWIKADDTSTLQYFRSEVTTSGIELLQFFAAGGGDLEVFCRGEPIMEHTGLRRAGVAEVQLPAGTHTIAVRYRQRGPFNGFALCVVEETGSVDASPTYTLHEETGTDWSALGDTDPPPGWTPGRVLRRLVKEARDRATADGQTTALSQVKLRFDDEADYDEAAWTELVDRYWDNGTSLFDVMVELSESAVEWYMSPWGRLKLYNQRGTDRSVGAGAVKLLPGYNVTRMSHSRQRGLANHLLYRYAGGWGEHHSTPDAARREGFLSLGTADSKTEARRITGRTLDLHAFANTVTTLEIVDHPYAIPFRDFWVGDWVLAPITDGTLVKQRVLAMGWEWRDGRMVWAPELVVAE